MSTHANSTDKREMHPGDICTCRYYGYSQHDGCKRLVKRCLVDGCPCENFVFSHTVDASSRPRELPERPPQYEECYAELRRHLDSNLGVGIMAVRPKVLSRVLEWHDALEARIAHLEDSLSKAEETISSFQGRP